MKLIHASLILWTVMVTGAFAETPIICPPDAPYNVKLAAKEIRRYVYLRTGTLLPIVQNGVGIHFQVDKKLEPQEYRLQGDGKRLTITGGSDVGVLYGAYAFIEKLGVRFYLHGDVIPDEKIAFALPKLDETHKPIFALRGLQPFHDFPEGPDWWTLDEWKSIVAQTTKMRMNFIGLHTYPFHNKDLGPEPTVWVGLPEDVNADGTVKVADEASWYTTPKYMRYGCYAPTKTGDYLFGGAELFPTDNYGPEINGPDDFPMPKTPAAKVAMINRTGKMLNEIFTDAHRLGIKIAVGTEAPLDIPTSAKARLKEMGINPDDPAALQKCYEGMFTRIQRAYPIDYYWLWGHEGEIDEKRVIHNIEAAHAAMKSVKAPFSVGVCGWGWTASHFPKFHKIFSDDVFFSAINADTGHTAVSPTFNGLGNRPRWAIPWLEDDGALTSIEPWAARVRRDADLARRYGCNGLMGIFWRTRIMSTNIAALAQAGWNQDPWSQSAGKGKPHDLPVGDFYADWAKAEFGPQAGKEAARIFAGIDSRFPAASAWIRGPGAMNINKPPALSDYAFVDQFAALRPLVQGAGNLERFDWWLNTFRFNQTMARFLGARVQLNAILNSIDKNKDPQARKRLAGEKALPKRVEMVRLLGEMYNYLLATVHNSTELGTLCNVQQQSINRLKLLTGQDEKLVKCLGQALPAEAQPWKDYRGVGRLVVMNARTSAAKGESLKLKIIVLDKQPVKAVQVHVRPMGKGEWQTVNASHLARAIHEARLPASEEDLEYYVTAGEGLVWPATAPRVNQTVVIEE